MTVGIGRGDSALSGSAVFYIDIGTAAAITAVKEDYQEETVYEDEETIFKHPAQPRAGAGADDGDEPDGICGFRWSD